MKVVPRKLLSVLLAVLCALIAFPATSYAANYPPMVELWSSYSGGTITSPGEPFNFYLTYRNSADSADQRTSFTLHEEVSRVYHNDEGIIFDQTFGNFYPGEIKGSFTIPALTTQTDVDNGYISAASLLTGGKYPLVLDFTGSILGNTPATVYHIGDEITFDLHLNNPHLDQLTGWDIQSTLPAGLEVVSVAGEGSDSTPSSFSFGGDYINGSDTYVPTDLNNQYATTWDHVSTTTYPTYRDLSVVVRVVGPFSPVEQTISGSVDATVSTLHPQYTGVKQSDKSVATSGGWDWSIKVQGDPTETNSFVRFVDADTGAVLFTDPLGAKTIGSTLIYAPSDITSAELNQIDSLGYKVSPSYTGSSLTVASDETQNVIEVPCVKKTGGGGGGSNDGGDDTTTTPSVTPTDTTTTTTPTNTTATTTKATTNTVQTGDTFSSDITRMIVLMGLSAFVAVFTALSYKPKGAHSKR